MDIILSLLLGGVLGAAGASLWFLRDVKTGQRPTEAEFEARIAALEEAMTYALSRFEDVAATQQKSPRSRSKKQPVETDEDWQKVLSLAAEGLDPQSIARQVGKPQGQVELITKLYPKG